MAGLVVARRCGAAVLWLAACNEGRNDAPPCPDGCEDATGTSVDATSTSGGESSSGSSSGAPGSTSGSDDSTGGPESSSTGEASSSSTGEEAPDLCVADPLVSPPACTVVGDAGPWTPTIEWSWTGDAELGLDRIDSTPLVVQLTDDDGNGSVDGCDDPDVLVVARGPIDWTDPFGYIWAAGRLYAFDGTTGALHFRGEEPLFWQAQPGVGDLDGDGDPEIVAVGGFMTTGTLLAFDHEGVRLPEESFAIDPENAGQVWSMAQAPAFHDIDRDGRAELIVGPRVFAGNGELLAWLPSFHPGDISTGEDRYGATTVADLDADGLVELLVAGAAYTWENDWYWPYASITSSPLRAAFPHPGDFDGDGLTEVVVAYAGGISVIDDFGAVIVSAAHPVTPSADAPGNASTWSRPGSVADFDGDGVDEIAISIDDTLAVLELEGASLVTLASWTTVDRDGYGAAAPTAFDFDGDGVVEVVYADEDALYVRRVTEPDDPPLLTVPRTSRLDFELPVIADVDRDGSAEIVIASNEWQSWSEPGVITTGAPPLQIVGVASWVAARSVWHQHALQPEDVHVGGATATEPGARELQRVRGNVQVEDGRACAAGGER